MNILDLFKNPKEYLLKTVLGGLLTKAAEGTYGVVVKRLYWFFHDYAPQLAVILAASVEILKSLGGVYADTATRIEAALAFLGSLGLAVNLHATPQPANAPLVEGK